MSRRIHILCDGGLGNRVAGLLGGLITADRLKIRPIIHWPSNNWCGAFFEDLFDTSGFTHDRLGIRDLFSADSDCIFLTHENQTGVDLKKSMSHGRNSELMIQTRSEDVVFYTARVPTHISVTEILTKLNRIIPSDEIQATVVKFCRDHKISTETVGLHLRKTDQIHLDEDWWYDYVQHKGANKRYFVCSDDRDTEMRFSHLNNIVCYPKSHYVEKMIPGPWRQTAIPDTEGRVFPNNIIRGRESVIQAWIDLQILSRTTILPTVKSSFSQLAGWISQSRSL